MEQKPVSLDFVPVVSGRHLKTPVHLRQSRTVQGIVFFQVLKSDHCIVRLLLGRADSSHRALAKAERANSLNIDVPCSFYLAAIYRY